MNTVYFDYNATTPLRVEAKAAWCAAVDHLWLNPSSPYRAAARVAAHLSSVRERFAGIFEVAADRVVFNSGATEGNNAVFAHWSRALPAGAKVGVSPTEHPSVLEAAKFYFVERVVWLPLDANGAVCVAGVGVLLDAGTISAVSAMAANNDTGLLNDWAGLAAVCRSRGVPYHCDASQWVGKLPLAGLSACDYVTGCGHKFGGPRGVGFVILPKVGAAFSSLVGGAQEGGHRSGTEDVASVLAMVAALEASVPGAAAKSAALGVPAGRDLFLSRLAEELPQVKVVGGESARLWNTALLILPEFASVRWIRALETRCFLVSTGAACATGKAGASAVLSALGVDADAARRVVRVSSGWTTTDVDWQGLCAALVDSYSALRLEAASSGSKVISI